MADISFEDHLHIFCTSILNQLNGDATYEWLKLSKPICCNWRLYLKHCDISEQPMWHMQDKLTTLLAKEYGDGVYPFGGVVQFNVELAYNSFYVNDMRLAFLRKYAR